MEEKIKKCSWCKEEKILKDFYNNKKTKDGKSSSCILCTKERAKVSQILNKEYRKIYICKTMGLIIKKNLRVIERKEN